MPPAVHPAPHARATARGAAALAVAAALVGPLADPSAAQAMTPYGEVLAAEKVVDLGVVTGFHGDELGGDVVWLRDLDGNGHDDFAVTMAGPILPGLREILLVFMGPDGPLDAALINSGTLQALDPAMPNFSASSLLFRGDYDEDGRAELLVGSPWLNPDGVLILDLEDDGSVHSFRLITEGQSGFTGTIPLGADFGGSLAVIGDLDGNGFADLAVGASQTSSPGSDVGAVWVLLMGADDTVIQQRTLGNFGAGLALGLQSGDHFGGALAAPGDLDGNGVPDLIVGASRRDAGGFEAGAVFVLFFGVGGQLIGHHEISAASGDLAGLAAPPRWLGGALDVGNDLDGDGTPELFVGAAGATDELPAGAVFTLFLRPDGSVKDHRVIASFLGGLGVVQENSRFGTSVASATGPGPLVDERLLVGAPLDDQGGNDEGALWFLDLGLRTWHPLGHGLGGFLGTPSLTGTGSMLPGETVRVTLAGAHPNTTAWFVIGFDRVDLPFAGGTLVPDTAPPALVLPLPSGTGSITLEGLWPAGLPDLFETFFQVWVVDPTGPQGYTASNALKGVAG